MVESGCDAVAVGLALRLTPLLDCKSGNRLNRGLPNRFTQSMMMVAQNGVYGEFGRHRQGRHG